MSNLFLLAIVMTILFIAHATIWVVMGYAQWGKMPNGGIAAFLICLLIVLTILAAYLSNSQVATVVFFSLYASTIPSLILGVRIRRAHDKKVAVAKKINKAT